METTWQDIVVWVIGLTVAALVVRKLVCLLLGKQQGGCASCGSSGCPMHGAKHRRKRR